MFLATEIGYRGVTRRFCNACQMSSNGDLKMENAEKQPRRVVSQMRLRMPRTADVEM